MTRRRNNTCKENPTNILFKNSHNSVNTYSKTYSNASRFCTKSLVMQLKRKLPKTKYYEDQGTLKRDLSIETDICILRRYYKKNRTKLLNRGAVSAKSKYSINHTEIDTINEFTRDSSACGDSELTNKQEIPRCNINLTSLVVNNLKKLLNDWIKKYLLENNETKQKIDTVLDSILHKLNLQADDTSSCTYTVDVELEDQSSKAASLSTHSKNLKLKSEIGMEEFNKQKSSYLTIPLSNKYLQVISTLSIPRKQPKRNISKSLHKIKKFRHKKILLSISKSSKYLLTFSSLDFLTLRAKSLTKRFATYQRNDRDINNRPSTLYIQQSCDNKNILHNCNVSNETIRKVNSKKIPSIYKNIYDITPAQLISYESTNVGNKTCCNNVTEDQGIKIKQSPNSKIQKNPKIINEHDQSDPLITIDFGKHSGDISNLYVKSKNKLEGDKLITSKIKKNGTRFRKINLSNRKISGLQTYKNIKSKQFTYLFRKANNKKEKEKELLNHLQSILKYFSNYEGKKDIQLHIQINVGPITGDEGDTTIKSYINLDDSIRREVNSREENMKKTTPMNSQNIISLLDGASSQSKYIVSRQTSTELLKETSDEYNKIPVSQINNSEITQEISELRVIIKSLATTAEKLIKDHTCETGYVKTDLNNLKNDLPVNINLQHAIEQSLIDNALVKHSKGNQFSNKIAGSKIISGLKLRKEPKNKKNTAGLIKKSTSYNIIASESVLKITDMTSAAQNITYEKMMDEALTCSLPKSKSLFEIAIGPNKRKLLAFYCDDFVRPDEYIYNVCGHSTPCSSNQKRELCHRVKPNCVYSKSNRNDFCDDETCSEEPTFICTECVPVSDDCELIEDDNSCSSVCIDIDPTICTQKVTIRNRDGLGFWEGCLYCVLLWIPVMIISWLFYIHVIRDFITPRDNVIYRRTGAQSQKFQATVRPPPLRPMHPSHDSIVHSLTLSDLGF